MKRDLRDFLNDILLHIDEATKAYHAAERPLKYPTTEVMAMVYCLQVIGEAVKHVPDEIRNSKPEIQWKLIAGMRDVLIHQYWGIDLEAVERTVSNRLPKVKIAINDILEGLDPDK